MEKFTITYLYKLNVGDRFYKLKDRTKKVYEMVEAEPKRTRYRTYSFWGKADDADELTAFAGNTEVVFVRRNENVPMPKPKFLKIKPSHEHYYLMDLLS